MDSGNVIVRDPSIIPTTAIDNNITTRTNRRHKSPLNQNESTRIISSSNSNNSNNAAVELMSPHALNLSPGNDYTSSSVTRVNNNNNNNNNTTINRQQPFLILRQQ